VLSFARTVRGASLAAVIVFAALAARAHEASAQQAPRSFWPAEVASPPKFTPGTFLPADFAPPFPDKTAPGDGKWLAVLDPDAPTAPPFAFKTTVHPDPKLGFMQVAVLALDLTRLEVTLVAGTLEPESTTKPPPRRPGVIPQDRLAQLFAAFAGGFRATHGHFGMKLDGEVFLAPKDDSCTVVLDPAGGLRIGTWTTFGDRDKLPTYRQTPPCLVERGQIGKDVDARGVFGASISGEVMIRRSALGLDAAGRTLFYGFGEGVTPKAIAQAMLSAGAANAAQLDVNFAFPRFLFYVHPTPGRAPVVKGPLAGPVTFRPTEYFGGPEQRDFFYLTRKR
jgi:hypothetical protein